MSTLPSDPTAGVELPDEPSLPELPNDPLGKFRLGGGKGGPGGFKTPRPPLSAVTRAEMQRRAPAAVIANPPQRPSAQGNQGTQRNQAAPPPPPAQPAPAPLALPAPQTQAASPPPPAASVPTPPPAQPAPSPGGVVEGQAFTPFDVRQYVPRQAQAGANRRQAGYRLDRYNRQKMKRLNAEDRRKLAKMLREREEGIKNVHKMNEPIDLDAIRGNIPPLPPGSVAEENARRAAEGFEE